MLISFFDQGLPEQVQSQVDHRGRVATLRLMDQQQAQNIFIESTLKSI